MSPGQVLGDVDPEELEAAEAAPVCFSVCLCVRVRVRVCVCVCECECDFACLSVCPRV